MARSIRRGERTAESAVAECLAKIAEREPYIRAFAHVDADRAVAEARRLDREGPTGPLHGVPVAVKEVIDVAGMRCSWGTAIYRDRVPDRDARVVQKLRSAGAVIVGTTISTEYAIGAAGPTRNPHDLSRTPGGSSSGSAAAVAEGMVPIAIGSQTIGSIVRPATYCGVFGFKPTGGAVSTSGMMPMSEHLDHVGPMACSVADIALACEALFRTGSDGPDGVPVPAPKLEALPSRLKVLLIEDPGRRRIQSGTREALRRASVAFEALGVEVQTQALTPAFERCQSIIETILYHDLAKLYGADQQRFSDLMSARMRDILSEGRAISAPAYGAALNDATALRQGLFELLDDAVVLAPAVDGVAPPLSEGTGSNALQAIWTLLGFPALAVPCGQLEGMPVGVQIAARPSRDSVLLTVGSRLAGALSDGLRR